jgi:hypothetical protein
MHRDFPQRGEKARIVHNVQQTMTIEDMGRNVLSIYTTIDKKQSEFQSHMNEVERFQLPRRNLENLRWCSWIQEKKGKLTRWLRNVQWK